MVDNLIQFLFYETVELCANTQLISFDVVSIIKVMSVTKKNPILLVYHKDCRVLEALAGKDYGGWIKQRKKTFCLINLDRFYSFMKSSIVDGWRFFYLDAGFLIHIMEKLNIYERVFLSQILETILSFCEAVIYCHKHIRFESALIFLAEWENKID